MNSRPLETLIELAREARNQSAQTLAGERNNEQKLTSQYELLQRYRNEYAAQLQQRMHQGIDLASLRDYQSFLKSLDAAIDNARSGLRQQQALVTKCQQDWQQNQRQLSSYDTLVSRRRAEEQALSERRERRQQDETSTNLFLRNQRG